MIRRALALSLALASCTYAGFAQKVTIGIAPAYDGGGDDFGPAVVEHLTLYTYNDLIASKQFAPVLLNPGGVYTPLDTSWLTEYVQDRPDLDLLLVPTLKPIEHGDKGSWTITIALDLLDAHTGDTKASWTVSQTVKGTNAWLAKGTSMVTSAITQRASQYGYEMMASTDFEKQPIGKTTAQLADSIRDSMPAHLAGFAHKGAAIPDPSPAAAAPCIVHTRIIYSYKHSVSHSYTMMANGLDETTTLQDGSASFSAPEGPLLLQFSVHDTPYKMSAQPIYQLTTNHSCKSSTLVMDMGQGGEVHEHWE